MQIGQKLYKPVDDEAYRLAAQECNQKQDRTIEDKGQYFQIVPVVHQITIQDYDRIMEDHLREERIARGYTLRQPSDYLGSNVQRWKQDAQDWIEHRDAVMLYGLGIMNTYKETGEAPSLEEFKNNLPVITWTYQE